MRERRDAALETLRRWGVALALLCFVVIQGAVLGHVAGVDVLAPDHDRSACAFCAANDRAAPPAAAAEPIKPAIVFADAEAPRPLPALRAIDLAALPPARGPPAL